MGELITRDMSQVGKDSEGMSIRNIAEVLNLDPRTVQLKAKELFPDKVKNGIPTLLNEAEVTAIKLHLEKKFEVRTDLEKELMIHQAMQWQAEKITKLQAENEVMKPKAIAYDKFLAPDKAIPMSQAAKLLGTGRNRLFASLRENKILMSDNTPYQRCAEYFQVIFDTKNINGKEVNFPVTLVTPKGIDYIAKKLHIIPEAAQ